MIQTSDKLSPFLVTSAVLHVSLFALVFFGPLIFPKRAETSWGTNTDKAITVGVATSLPGIPLPSPPIVQEKAKPADTKTLHPVEVPPKPAKAPSKPADVKIPERGATKSAKPEASSQVSKAASPPPPAPATNAIPGNDSGQIALPYGQRGTGPATFGGDGTFGTRFPGYVNDMTRAIEAQWQRPARPSSERVYVTFTIIRRGGSAVAQDVKIDKESGSPQLDSSARRAVMTAALPPLPRDFSGSSVDVRFYFDYTR